uniref:Uncharacterized protein n=1 Tax=Oryza nivara TaxID=4536 RepID=A0A0E0IFB2_ORYNI
MLGEEAERISHRWNDGSRKKRSKMTMETTGHPQNPEIILRCIVREIRVLRSLGLGWDLSLAPPSNPSDAVHLQEPEGAACYCQGFKGRKLMEETLRKFLYLWTPPDIHLFKRSEAIHPIRQLFQAITTVQFQCL